MAAATGRHRRERKKKSLSGMQPYAARQGPSAMVEAAKNGAEDLNTGGRRTAATGHSASEDLARKIVEKSGIVSREAMTKALHLCKVPLQQRHNVAPRGASSVRGMNGGLFVYAGRIGISAASHRFPWLTRLLALFGRQPKNTHKGEHSKTTHKKTTKKHT